MAEWVGDGLATKAMPWGSPQAKKCMELFSGLGGFDVRITFSFTPKQCSHYTHFILTPKFIYQELDSVFQRNLDHYDSLPVHHEDPYGRYKVVESVFINKIKARQDRMWALEQFESYFISPEYLKTMLHQFSGFKHVEVKDYKTEAVSDQWSSFCSDTWLPSFDMNQTCELVDTDFGKKTLRSFGLFAASVKDLDALPDLARTPCSDFKGDSGYIVSSRVWQYWTKLGMSSFIPNPV